MSKITVIGAGSVGATIANDLMVQGIASEIVLVDINKQKAFGEALDIYQGAPFCSPAIVRAGDYPDAAGSDIVVITSGMPRKPGMKPEHIPAILDEDLPQQAVTSAFRKYRK